MSSYKVINISNPGTSIKFGGDDLDLVAKTLNGQVAGLPPVILKNQNKVTFGDNILHILNPAETNVMRLRTPAFDHDIDVYLPDTADNILTLLSADATNTFEVEQTFDSFQLLKRIAEPSNPSAGYLVFWADNDGTTKVKDENGDIMTIMSSVAGATNLGTPGVFHSLVGNTLQFKYITSSSPELVIDNTTDPEKIDFSIDLGNLDLQDLGGTLANSQLAQITDKNKQHSSTMYKDTISNVTARHVFGSGITMANSSVPTPATDSITIFSSDSLKFKDDQGVIFNAGGEEPSARGSIWQSDAALAMKELVIGDPGQVLTVNSGGTDLEYQDPSGGGGSGIISEIVRGGRQYGWYIGIPLTVGNGLLSGEVSTIGVVTTTHDFFAGPGVRIEGTDGGGDGRLLLSGTSKIFRKKYNPIVEFDFYFDQTGAVFRCYMCFLATDGTFDSDTEFNNNNCFGLFKKQAENTLKVCRNDGSATVDVDTSVLTLDLNVHHAKIELEPSANKGIVTIDSNSPVEFLDSSHKIPGSTTALYFGFAMDEEGGSSNTYLNVFNFKCSYKIQ